MALFYIEMCNEELFLDSIRLALSIQVRYVYGRNMRDYHYTRNQI